MPMLDSYANGGSKYLAFDFETSCEALWGPRSSPRSQMQRTDRGGPAPPDPPKFPPSAIRTSTSFGYPNDRFGYPNDVDVRIAEGGNLGGSGGAGPPRSVRAECEKRVTRATLDLAFDFEASCEALWGLRSSPRSQMQRTDDGRFTDDLRTPIADYSRQ